VPNYRDLQDRIALDYLTRYDLMDAVKRSIKNTIKTYEASRFWFNEAQTAMACSAGQSYISVPSDFLQLDRLEIQYSGAATPLKEASLDVIRTMNVVSATSVPTHFTYHGDRFELALIPDSAYPATCFYIKSLPELSADTDSNAWTNEAQNLIAHCACVELLSNVIYPRETQRISFHMNMLQMATNELNLRNTMRFGGRLRATQF